ncbi:C-GCAxxG-C-C family protein [bacterium]|nr:C-GCAxxG-C-C family protein [bacterium]
MIRFRERKSSMHAARTFMKVGSCSETMLNVINRAYGTPMELEEKAAMPMAGGILQHGYQCGQIWGSVLAAGAKSYRLYDDTPKAQAAAILAAQRIVDSFFAMKKTINCLEITDTDHTSTKWEMMKFFMLKGGAIGCFHLASKFAPVALADIETSLSQDEYSVPEGPVSCAAEMARKLGASPMHTVMAAGLAGGIGFSGGACGALGAVLWLKTIQRLEAGAETVDYRDEELQQIMEKFQRISDYRYECEEIAGTKFKTVSDHADYLHEGGCAALMDGLAMVDSV